MAECEFYGCTNPRLGKKYCRNHSRREKLYGRPDGGRASGGEPAAWIDANKSSTSDECIDWPFAVMATGYGLIMQNGKFRGAHRVMCEAAHGEASHKSMQAAHSCGRRICTNPRHIRWATVSENQMDRVKHGTSNRGEQSATAKLTEVDVISIRKMARVASMAHIARHFGVDPQTVSNCVRRKTWKHLE